MTKHSLALHSHIPSHCAAASDPWQFIAHLGDHSVVNDAALLIGEHAEGAGAIGDARDVADHQLLQERHCILALQQQQQKS